jgi:transposase-like protein
MIIRLWSASEEKVLIGLYDSDLTVAEIAQKLGRTPNAVMNRARRLRRTTDIVNRSPPIAPETKQTALALRAEGRKIADIAREVGVLECQISKWARAANMPPRHVRRRLTEENRARLRERAAAGENWNILAREFGCHRKTVWYLMRDRPGNQP